MQVGQKLHAVQVTSRPLAQMVIHRQLLATVGARKPLSRRVTHTYTSTRCRSISSSTRSTRPPRRQTQQLSVQFHAFHRTLPVQDVLESLGPTDTIV